MINILTMSEAVVEECWDLDDDFDLYARPEIRTVHFPSGSQSFQIECVEPNSPLDINNKSQSSSQYDATGHCVWAGAFLLIQCIHELENVVDTKNRTIIEFGCGTGIGGLAMMLHETSKGPSNICFTDNDPAALKVCERNCKLNNLHDTSYTTRELTWGEEADTHQKKNDALNDIALATDVLYDVDLIKPLFTTVSKCIPSGGIFILSHIPRACYNEGNPPEAVEDLEQYIIDQAVKYDLHLEIIIRPPKDDDFTPEILDWCPASAFVGGGILVFRRS